MLNTDTNVVVAKKRLDYEEPSHTIKKANLRFELDPEQTKVKSRLSIKRLLTSAKSIILDGEGLQLISVKLNNNTLQEGEGYHLRESALEVLTELDEFELEIENFNFPNKNTSLEGLYYSNEAFCTQCEAEGFRKITYFLDRPDVLANFEVELVSTNKDLTYLLSNGNLISDSGFRDGQRTCVWKDPFPKPCYLFALVAGHFDKLEDTYTTKSGKHIALELFVDVGRLSQGQHALDSLKKSMKWDEDTYNLEYDLDIYMIVAVDFFNMGAMENKGLNVFNSKYVLAQPSTATDQDYFNIESIIAHEYFHNWTGNRVTCRDWFQLSLKEGLTVFRDQQFSADMYSELMTRISQVEMIREHQFAEDAGPMSHPIRPDIVMEMNNFYTVTVYDKGAEVIRMLHTMLGAEGFKAGLLLYFSRHDGQAVTCDDFVAAMQDANKVDLSHFSLWYSQSGTPLVNVTRVQTNGAYQELVFEQVNPTTFEQTEKQPLYIPIKLECFNSQGEKIELGLVDDTYILNKEKAILKVTSKAPITPSLLQDFSAPVKIDYQYTDNDLFIIVESAKGHYAKWEAQQILYKKLIAELYKQLEKGLSEAEAREQTNLENTLERSCDILIQMSAKNMLPNEVLAQLCSLPSTESMFSVLNKIEPLLLNEARSLVQTIFARKLEAFCGETYYKIAQTQANDVYRYEKSQVNDRTLKNTCLSLLSHTKNVNKYKDIVNEHFDKASNMTDRLAALGAALAMDNKLFSDLMTKFEDQFSSDTVVMDKWFSLHAKSETKDILSQLDLLQAHSQYTITNPNKVRSLIGSFAFYNIKGFHQKNGAGYKYLADYIIELDSINPQVASRLLTPLMQHSTFKSSVQDKMKAQLSRIFSSKTLSKDLSEKLIKALS